MNQMMRSEMGEEAYGPEYESRAEFVNAVAEFSYRVGIAVVVALVCMLVVAFLGAGKS